MEKLRLKVQILAAVFFNIGLMKWHFICFPVFNCHSCPISIFACPLGVIGQFAGVGLIPFTVIGTVALAGLVAGRILCGWACPFGLAQDLLYRVPFPKFNIPSWTRFIKYGVFAGLVVLVPVFLTTDSPIYFCRICPVATVESAIPWALMQGTSNVLGLSIRLAILFAVVLLVMGHKRLFCKMLCPLGACLSVFNRLAAFFPERNVNCNACGTCEKVCPMTTGGERLRAAVFDNRPEECISCLQCKEKCPTSAVEMWGS